MKKAKEYYNTYSERLKDMNGKIRIEACKELIQDFMDDFGAIVKKRGKSNSTVDGIIRELNEKWNALARMFNPPAIKKDGFINYVQKILSEYEKNEQEEVETVEKQNNGTEG